MEKTRIMTMESVGELMDFERLCFPAECWREEDWRELLDDPRATYYALMDGARMEDGGVL